MGINSNIFTEKPFAYRIYLEFKKDLSTFGGALLPFGFRGIGISGEKKENAHVYLDYRILTVLVVGKIWMLNINL